MIKAIIFDVDGVLVDSKAGNRVFYQRILTRAGYIVPSDDKIDGCFHLPLWQSIEHLIGSADQNEVKRLFDIGTDPGIYPREMMSFPKSLHDVLGLLHQKYHLGIVTGRIAQGIEAIYDKAGVRDYFDAAVSYEDYTHPKPHPEPLEVALKKLDSKPDQAIYVGDSDVDVEAAKAAGIWSIHYSSSKHRDATVMVTSFDQLPDAVDHIEALAKS